MLRSCVEAMRKSFQTCVRGNGKKKVEPIPTKRDTGWAWLVMFASFTLQLFIDGTISGFGVVFLALQQDEAFNRANYTRTFLAMPGSIQPGFFLCTGAFASPFIQKFGFRLTGTFASVLVSSGLSLSSMQTNMHLFNLFYGVIAGVGFGILMVCAIVSVNFYFERFRGISSGVAMAGAGVGYLAIPFLLSKFVEIFGWRNALLVYSLGIFPVILLSVLTFRPFIMSDDDFDSEEELQLDGEQLSPDELNEDASIALECKEKVQKPSEVLTPQSQLSSKGQEPCNGMSVSLVDASSLIQHTEPNQPSKQASIPSSKATPLGSRCPSELSRPKSIPEEPTAEQRPSANNFANLIRQYLFRQRTPAPEEFDHTHTDNFDDEFGSTVGSRLWKSTQVFKRRRVSSKSQQPPFLSHARGMGSGDFQVAFRRAKRTRPKRSCALDPFEQMDIFFSANLASLGYRDAYMRRRTSGQQSRLSHSHLQEMGQLRTFHESAASITPSGVQLDRSQPHIHASHVSFAGLTSSHKRSYITSLSSFKEHGKPYLTHDEVDGAEETLYVNEVQKPISPPPSFFPRLHQKLITLFDLRLFTNPSFLFLMAVGIFNQLAYFIPFVYLVDFAVSKGLEHNQAILLVVVLGSFHTAGRIIAGCAANLVWMDTVYLSGIGTLAGGIFNILLPLIFPANFLWYSVYAALFGVACAFPIPMIHILLVRFLGLGRLTASYSNLNLAKSFASVIGPLVAVNIVETTGEADHYFFVAGVCFILSALAHLGLCRFPCSSPVDELEDDLRADCCMCLVSRQDDVQVYAEDDEEVHPDLP